MSTSRSVKSRKEKTYDEKGFNKEESSKMKLKNLL